MRIVDTVKGFVNSMGDGVGDVILGIGNILGFCVSTVKLCATFFTTEKYCNWHLYQIFKKMFFKSANKKETRRVTQKI